MEGGLPLAAGLSAWGLDQPGSGCRAKAKADHSEMFLKSRPQELGTYQSLLPIFKNL
jgi:hypothetical protein